MGMGTGMLLGAVVVVMVFTFVTVASWAESRRKEREAYYRTDLLKQLSQQGGPAADRVVDILRDEHRRIEARRDEGLKLGGLVSMAVGLGMMVFLRVLVDERAVFLVGLIPLSVGIAMLVYVYLVVPKLDGR